MSVIDHEVEGHIERPPDEPPDVPERPQGAESGSLLASLQAKRQELAERGPREERKLVPLWDGALSIVYRYPEGGTDPIVKAVERAQRSGKPEATFNANCDVLIACCHAVEGRQPGGEWEPLDSSDDRPVKLHHRRLADLLQIEVPENLKSPGRFIARHVFSPLAATTGVFEGDIPLMTQAGEIIAWLNGVEDETDDALVGE